MRPRGRHAGTARTAHATLIYYGGALQLITRRTLPL